MTEPKRQLTPEEAKKRRTKNLIVAGVLFGLVVLFFLITIVKIKSGLA